jgi:hypothetical protein
MKFIEDILMLIRWSKLGSTSMTQWLPMTDEDVDWVNNPGKIPVKS